MFISKFQSLLFLIFLQFYFNLINVQQNTHTLADIIYERSINISTSIYGNLIKIRSNRDYLIRLSNTNFIHIYSNMNYSNLIILKANTGTFLNQATQFVDFSLQTQSTLAILSNKALFLYNIKTKQIIIKLSRPCIICGNWEQVLISTKHYFIVNQNKKVFRYSRENLMLVNQFKPNFVFAIKTQICQNNNGDEVLGFYSSYNRVKLHVCSYGKIECPLTFQIPPNDKSLSRDINRLTFTTNCQKLFVQRDSLFQPSIYNRDNTTYKILNHNSSIVYLFTRYDHLDLYSIILQSSNNRILIFSNNPSNNTIIKQYSNFINFQSIVDIDKFNNYFYLGFRNEIKILKTQCPSMSYMKVINLCYPCSNLCLSCNKMTGKCESCANISQYLSINGNCIQKNNTTTEIESGSYSNINQNITSNNYSTSTNTITNETLNHQSITNNETLNHNSTINNTTYFSDNTLQQYNFYQNNSLDQNQDFYYKDQKQNLELLKTLSLQQFQDLYNFVFNYTALNPALQIPGTKVLFKGLFTFFSCFDDFYLYLYHQRQYDAHVSFFFLTIENYQQIKWNFIPKNQFQGTFINTYTQSLDKLKKQVYSKKLYTSSKFIRIQNSGSGYLENTIDLNFLTIPVDVIIFLFAKLLYKLLKKYKISTFFQQYQYWTFFIYMITDRNIQRLSYYFGFELSTLFYQKIQYKLISSIILIIIFLYFLICSCFCWFCKYFDQSKSIQIYYENGKKRNLIEFYHLTLSFGIRNWFLGFLHIINEKNYQLKMLTIISFQIIWLINNCIYVRKVGQIKLKFRVWLQICLIAIRLLLISSFLFEKDVKFGSQQYFSQSNSILISIYILFIIISLIYQSLIIILSIIKLFLTKQKIENLKINLNNTTQYPLKSSIIKYGQTTTIRQNNIFNDTILNMDLDP